MIDPLAGDRKVAFFGVFGNGRYSIVGKWLLCVSWVVLSGEFGRSGGKQGRCFLFQILIFGFFVCFLCFVLGTWLRVDLWVGTVMRLWLYILYSCESEVSPLPLGIMELVRGNSFLMV